MGPITKDAKKLMKEDYKEVSDPAKADAIFIRSKNVLNYTFPDSIVAIGRAGVGVNTIPVEKCAKQGIVVFNAPGANSNGVKEMTIMALVFSQRDIISSINWLRSIENDTDLIEQVEKKKGFYAGEEIRDKSLGVIGLGAIGGLVANSAVNLDMNVKGYDPYISVSHAWGLSRSIKRVATIEKAVEDRDVITIHVPQKSDTLGLVNKELIRHMKKGVVIINFARGGIIDEDAIMEGLNSGKISQYITDFPSPKVMQMKNTIVIPHLGGSTIESENNCASMAVREVMNYLENGNIGNSVNYPSIDAGICRSVRRITINHLNQPSMITRFATILSTNNVNIARLYNNSLNDVAYSIIDLDTEIDEITVKALESVPGVLKLRVLEKRA